MEERDNSEKQNKEGIRFTSGYQDIPLHFRDRPDSSTVRKNRPAGSMTKPAAFPEGSRHTAEEGENRYTAYKAGNRYTADETGRRYNADEEALRGLSDEARSVLKQMYAAGSEGSQGSRMDAEIFYRQGRIISGLEDHFPVHERYQAYFPTYKSMKLRQLREYLTWRTSWRKTERAMLSGDDGAGDGSRSSAGDSGGGDESWSSAGDSGGGDGSRIRNPSETAQYVKDNISFAYMHAYELINNTDDIPAEEGYRKLAILYRTFGRQDGWFRNHLWRWMRDFAVYYQVDPKLTPDEDDSGQGEAVRILETFEQYLRTADTGAEGSVPDRHDVFRAICCLASRDPSKSPFYRKHPEDMEEICVRSYAAVCRFYLQNGKRMLLETIYGGKDNFPYYMFQTAIFYDRLHNENYRYVASDSRVYVCRDGRWTCERYLFMHKKDTFLGDVMREAESNLRDLMGYRTKLTKKIASSAVAEVIAQTAEDYLEEKREAARPKVHIELGKLGEIRQNAAHTRNQLIVDDEFADPIAALNTGNTGECTLPAKFGDESSVLTPGQKDFLRVLLAGGDGRAYVHEHPGLGSVSLLADEINEALYDQIGDTVIELDGETPTLISDYREDVENCCR